VTSQQHLTSHANTNKRFCSINQRPRGSFGAELEQKWLIDLLLRPCYTL